jgi:hypothetical protein
MSQYLVAAAIKPRSRPAEAGRVAELSIIGPTFKESGNVAELESKPAGWLR